MRRFAISALLMLGAMILPAQAFAQEERCQSDVPAGQEYAAWAGPWAKHGAGLNVRQDGCGALTWRTYQPCAFGVYDGACDIGVNHGAKAVFVLTARDGATTSGRMLARTYSAPPPNFGIVLRLKPDGTLGVEWDGAEHRFCRTWDWRPDCGA